MKSLLLICRCLCLCGLILATASTADAKSVTGHGGTIAKFDFSDAKAWPSKSASSSNAVTTVTTAKVGTIDAAGSTQASGGLLLSVAASQASKNWQGALISGKLPVKNGVTNVQKLTLSFSLSASSNTPIAVRVESFNAAKKRTGGLTAQIFPAAPNFYQHYAVDLSAMKSFGAGQFRATDPFVQFSFVAHSEDAPQAAASKYEIRLDNVNYASPAYYVSPAGSDANDGQSETTAFATPQKALNAAEPGDIILLMDGTYHAGQTPVADFVRPGAPDAWIVLKNYPGHHPTLSSTGWNIVSIAKGSSTSISQEPALAYLEVRGLHVRGEGDVAKQKYPDAMNQADSRTNSNGIAVDGRFSAAAFHDIRVADNVVEFAPGCGIGSIDADWVTVENNICRSNCWTTIYAPSGISVMGSANFDGQDNVYKRLVRNNVCCHNQTYEKWHAINRYSDGNGIILDVNQGSDAHKTLNYIGRTLVQSNLCYDNGGSGIHTVTANRVDIINNTVYHNSASVHLEYSEMFTYGSSDVHFINNIMVAPVANVAEGELPEPVNKGGGKNTDVTFSHNVYWGGNIAPTLGEGDVIADPQFVSPSIDDKTANFHLRPTSPAVGKGAIMPFFPSLDLDGKPRHQGNPAEGAYEE